MKKLFAILSIVLLCGAMWSCEYDDSDIWNKIDDLDVSITTLQDAVKKTNSDLSTLRQLVENMKNSITISKVVPTENGYTIKFSDGTEATISNGKNGRIHCNNNGTGMCMGRKEDEREWICLIGRFRRLYGSGFRPQHSQ